mgnify:CR=1 FL=1
MLRISKLTDYATVLLAHKACISGSGAVKLGKRGIDSKDPDWFRQFLF